MYDFSTLKFVETCFMMQHIVIFKVLFFMSAGEECFLGVVDSIVLYVYPLSQICYSCCSNLWYPYWFFCLFYCNFTNILKCPSIFSFVSEECYSRPFEVILFVAWKFRTIEWFVYELKFLVFLTFWSLVMLFSSLKSIWF